MAMVEREQDHRIKTDQQALNAMVQDTKRGHWMGLLISLVALGGAIGTALMDVPVAVPIALLGIPVLGVVKAFLPERRDSND